MKKWIFLFLILGLLAGPWTGQAETWQDSFEKQIKEWAEQLGSNDERFLALAGASFEYEGLGPNSHQWLVTFYSGDQEIGYMVVGEDSSGFSLLEYGLGEFTIFEPSAVAPFLEGEERLTAHYAGLQSIWISDSGIYDAKSGEKYPTSANVAGSVSVTSGIKKGSSLTQVIHDGKTEDSIAWMKPERTISNQDELIRELGDGDLSLVARFFQGTVIAPFQVVGGHIWNDGLFVELDDYGSRYVPFDHAVQIGNFVQ